MKQFPLFILLLIALHATAQPAWQQRVDTKIDVRLDDNTHFLHAFEELTYTNNSPDTLRFLYIHLWPNAYKNDHTPMARQLDLQRNTSFYYAKAKDRGYIDSLQFNIDGQSVDYLIADNTPDIARIDLLKPLLPGKKITITTPFRVKIPLVFSRMGHTGQAYFISQWFPKPAVYDLLGWHPISYLEYGEFFSEYGSYDVNITLPANYVLMATGNCMDKKEQSWLDELAKKPLPAGDSTTTIPETDSMVASSGEMKTVHFHEDNIHDFAWFADKRWLVQKDTVSSPGSGNLVTVWSAFLPSYTQTWKNANAYLKETVKHYGKWVGPYPYKTIKAVLGDMKAGGGMEYPTITVIDKTAKTGLQTVIIHEAGHNWFYGMLGSNERDHAWLDEGINTFYEQKTTRELSHELNSSKSKLDENLLYYESAAIHQDQAIEQTSANFTKLNYGLDIYYKSGLMLRWLEKYIGEDDFEKGMKDYYDTWHFHHPYPADLRACIQRHTARPVDWFFDTILNSNKKIDFTITNATVNGSNTEVSIRNNTGVDAPVLIDAMSSDSIIATIWTPPFANSATINIPTDNWDKLKIDGIIPDAKSANDVYRRNGLFHRFGVKTSLVAGLNMSEKNRLFISPAMGDNLYDGFMAGVLFHNLTLPENRFRFAVAPQYAFATNSFTGAGSVGYLWYPENLFREIMLQGDAKTFHYDETHVNLPDPLYARYTKFAPSLLFTFNEHDPLSTVTRSILLKGYYIIEQSIDTNGVAVTTPTVATQQKIPTLATQQKVYGLLRYSHLNDRTYNPFSYTLEYHGNGDFGKLSAEGDIRIDYDVKNKSLYVRGFLGKYFAINNDPAITSRYELNASYTGIDDYLYDGTYKGRSAQDGTGARQISMQEGGFKIPTYNNVDRSDNWMATINLASDLPGKWKVPFRLFFDAGLIPNFAPDMKHSGSTSLLYDGGVEMYLLKDIFSVYFPVIMSSDFQNYLTNTYGRKNVFPRSISFTLQLQNINWLKLPEKVFRLAN